MASVKAPAPVPPLGLVFIMVQGPPVAVTCALHHNQELSEGLRTHMTTTLLDASRSACKSKYILLSFIASLHSVPYISTCVVGKGNVQFMSFSKQEDMTTPDCFQCR